MISKYLILPDFKFDISYIKSQSLSFLGFCQLYTNLDKFVKGGSRLRDHLQQTGLWACLGVISLIFNRWKRVQPTVGSDTPG